MPSDVCFRAPLSSGALALAALGTACSGGSSGVPTLAGSPDASPTFDAGGADARSIKDGGGDASVHDAVAFDAPSTTDASSDVATDSASDGDADGSDAASGAFVTAPHTLPVVTDNGGPTLAHPRVVTVTYANDAQRASVESLDGYLVTSPWLSAIGPQYGVGLGTNVNVELPGNAPATIDDRGIQAIVESLIAAGTAPDPDGGVEAHELSPSLDGGLFDGGADAWNGSGDGGPPIRMPDAIYMMFFPTSTAITVDGTPMCTYSGGGYHSQTVLSSDGQAFAYAVLTQCPGGTSDEFTQAISHELIEAATDPSLGNLAYYLVDPLSPWATVGGEVGDLCAFVAPQWSEGGFTGIQRVYSNASAAAGGDPCLPAAAAYYGADAVPGTAQAVAAGSSVTYTVTGWSTAPVSDWSLSAQLYTSSPSTFQPTFTATAPTLNNGQTAQVTVSVPSDAASGSYALGLLYSYDSQTDYSTTLIEVYVP